MNKVMLTGRLVKDVEIRKTTNGTSIATFTVAVRKTKEEADFVRCKGFNNVADILEKWTRKGSQIGVEGRIVQDSYESNGQKIYKQEVIVDKIELLDSKKSDEPIELLKDEELEISEEDLPF